MAIYIHACIFVNVCVGRELQVAVADHDSSFVGIKEVSFLDPDDVMFALLLSISVLSPYSSCTCELFMRFYFFNMRISFSNVMGAGEIAYCVTQRDDTLGDACDLVYCLKFCMRCS